MNAIENRTSKNFSLLFDEYEKPTFQTKIINLDFEHIANANCKLISLLKYITNRY